MNVSIKRAYALPGPRDGYRVLVDRLWPRAVSKADACIDDWWKACAPSPKYPGLILSATAAAALLVWLGVRLVPESTPVARGATYAYMGDCIGCHGQPGEAPSEYTARECAGESVEPTHPRYEGSCRDLLAYFVTRIRRGASVQIHFGVMAGDGRCLMLISPTRPLPKTTKQNASAATFPPAATTGYTSTDTRYWRPEINK